MHIRNKSRRYPSRKAQQRNDRLFLLLAALCAANRDEEGMIKNLNRIIFDTIPASQIVARPEFRPYRPQLRRLFCLNSV